MLGRRLSRRVYTDGFAPRLGYLPWRVLSTTHTFAALPITVASSVVTPTFGPAIVPRGPATAATLVFDYENGGTITYSWATDILRARNGKETRLALNTCPRETYSFVVELRDGDLNYLQSKLVANAARGRAFAVALMHESIPIAPTSGSIFTVASTALLDWVYAGQTVAALAPNGTSWTGMIAASTSTTITVDSNIGAVGARGARLMPTIPSYLEDTQGFAHYPNNLTRFELKARAVYFGNASSSWSFNGGSVTTYTDPFTAVTYPVWDRGLDNDDTLGRSLVSGIDITDTGGVLTMTAPQSYSDFARELSFHTKNDADRQFWKAFMGATCGRQKAFLLPTDRPDLVPLLTTISGSLLTVLGGITGFADYAGQWFGSGAQARLKVLFTNGVANYVNVTDSVDNHNGTESLQLDRSLTGTIARISFLETCRFDTDDFPVTYADGTGYLKVPVMAVQQ
jgi:hypothetical protein